MQALSKINAIENALNGLYVDREDVIHGLLLAALSRQHIFMLGPPGVGKTEMTLDFCNMIQGAEFFEHLMMRGTTPDEVLGCVNIQKMRENSEWERVTNGMLPNADVAFLDEMWRVGSATANALLRIMDNTRMFQGEKCPLMFLVGASNSLPEDEDLNAIYSRFALRFMVNDIRDEDQWKEMIWEPKEIAPVSITKDDIREAYKEILQVEVTDATKKAAVKIREKLIKNMQVHLTPRSWHWAISEKNRKGIPTLSLVKVEAFLAGRKKTKPEDLNFLRWMAWDEPKQIKGVSKIVMKTAAPRIERLRDELDKVVEQVTMLKSNLRDGQSIGKSLAEEIMSQARKLDQDIEKALGKSTSGAIGSELRSISRGIKPMKAEIASAALKCWDDVSAQANANVEEEAVS